MKRVTIWDMDFYYKKSFKPNPTAMKLSSYHKQKECLINFVTEDSHIGLSYDIFYIIKEKENTPKPPGKYLHDKRVRLIGRPFRFFDNRWAAPAIISAVRPDYLLYPEQKNNAYYNAHIAQFYHKNILLNKKQPFKNVLKHHRKTLVIDKYFWDASKEDVITCLIELQEYQNIAFEHPISMMRIANDSDIAKLFIELHFSTGTYFKFRNNYGHSLEQALVLFDFIEELKSKHSHVRIGDLPFKAVTTDHWLGTDFGLYDLERCLRIATEAKKRKIHIRLVSPRNRFESPFWYYFEMLEHWTVYLEEKSYIELMLNSSVKRLKLPWYVILNNQSKWMLPNLYFLLSMMINKREWIEKYGYIQWGESILDYKVINWNEIEKYRGVLHDDMTNTESEDNG